MITEEYVIIPLEVQGIVPYGIGSVKIDREGNMEFIAPSGKHFGQVVQNAFRHGEIDRLMLVSPTSMRAVPAEEKQPD